MILKIAGAMLGPLLLILACEAQAPKPQVKVIPTAVESMKATPPKVPGQPNSINTPIKLDMVTLEKGKRLYMANCIQCHNRDPNVKGPIGPEMVDAPLSVMISKVMTSNYPSPLPAGFVPKRKSHAMRAIPKLRNDIPAIHGWVQSVKKKRL